MPPDYEKRQSPPVVNFGNVQPPKIIRTRTWRIAPNHDPSSGKDKSDILNDLFLLLYIDPSHWVSDVSGLAPAMSTLESNADGFIPNILYVDFYERSRVIDVSLEMINRLVH